MPSIVDLSSGLHLFYADCRLRVDDKRTNKVYDKISGFLNQHPDVAGCALVGSVPLGLSLQNGDVDIFIGGSYADTSSKKRRIPPLLKKLRGFLKRKGVPVVGIPARVPILKARKYRHDGRDYSIDFTCCNNVLYNMVLMKGKFIFQLIRMICALNCMHSVVRWRVKFTLR